MPVAVASPGPERHRATWRVSVARMLRARVPPRRRRVRVLRSDQVPIVHRCQAHVRLAPDVVESYTCGHPGGKHHYSTGLTERSDNRRCLPLAGVTFLTWHRVWELSC